MLSKQAVELMEKIKNRKYFVNTNDRNTFPAINELERAGWIVFDKHMGGMRCRFKVKGGFYGKENC